MSPTEAALLQVGDVILRNGSKGIVRDFAKEGVKVQWDTDAGNVEVLRYFEMATVMRSDGWA